MSKPTHRIVAKEKATGKYFQCGALWGTKFEGTLNLTSVKESMPDAKYPQLTLADVLKRQDEFFINVYEVVDKPTEDF